MTNPFQRLRQFLSELKRRKVYRVAISYVVVAAGAVQLVGVVVPASRLPGWSDEFFVALAVFGFPIAVVLAWAFEITPEGVRRTEAPAGRESDGAGLQWVGLGLVVLLAGGAWYVTSDGAGNVTSGTTAGVDTAAVATSGADAPRSSEEPGEHSIAVLPFDNLSGSQEAQPFVNGIHEDLLTRLSTISDLSVTSRTSVLPYRETELPLPAIADSLGVRWIVEGGVQQAGDRVQVNAQLIQAEEDVHRWAKTYRRELTTANIFAIQEELTNRIASSLEAELTAEEQQRVQRRPPENLRAFRLYVEAGSQLEGRTEGGIRRAIELFGQAVAQDSAYARAWSGLADARRLLAYYGHADPDTMYPAALTAARRALRLNPELAEAHASLGSLYTVHLSDLPAALRELRRAVELRPSYATAHMWLGERLAYGSGDLPKEALDHARRAVELDPHSPITHLVVGWMYFLGEGDREYALRHVRRASELEPGLALAHADEGFILSDAGRQEEAKEAFRRGLTEASEGSLAWAWALAGLGTAHVRDGDTTQARKLLQRLEGQDSARFAEGLLLAALGELSESTRRLRDASWEAWKMWDLRAMPTFGVLRGDPRYRDLMRDLNRRFGLNPDGSLPDSVEGSFGAAG